MVCRVQDALTPDSAEILAASQKAHLQFWKLQRRTPIVWCTHFNISAPNIFLLQSQPPCRYSLGHCMCMSKERNLTFQLKKNPLFSLTQVWLSRECATLHWIMKSWLQTIHCPNINDFLEHGYWLICADYVRESRDGSTSSAFFFSPCMWYVREGTQRFTALLQVI